MLREEYLLGEADDPEGYYLDVVLPGKIEAYRRELAQQSFWRDLRTLAATLLLVRRFLLKPPTPAPRPLRASHRGGTCRRSPRQRVACRGDGQTGSWPEIPVASPALIAYILPAKEGGGPAHAFRRFAKNRSGLADF